MKLPLRAFIGLGSNLDDPRHQVLRAVTALEALPRSRVQAVSSLYMSPPMGPSDQPDYINAVVQLETALEAAALLAELQEIETRQGRVRGRRWGARTLDLDLLVYGQERIFTETLTVPHPGLPQRAFVLYPLAELAPDLDVPGYGPVQKLIQDVDPAGLVRLD